MSEKLIDKLRKSIKAEIDYYRLHLKSNTYTKITLTIPFNEAEQLLQELEAIQGSKKYYVFKKGLGFNEGYLIQFTKEFSSIEEAKTFCNGEVDETFIFELIKVVSSDKGDKNIMAQELEATQTICNCEQWTDNKHKLNGYIQLAYSHGFELDHDKFKYCPYCGKLIPKEEK